MLDLPRGSLYPVLPLRDIVVFPHMIVPLFVGREKSVRALEDVMKEDKQILLVTQKNAAQDDPSASDIFTVGTVGTVLQLLKLPDGTVKVLVEGGQRARIVRFSDNPDFFQAYDAFKGTGSYFAGLQAGYSYMLPSRVVLGLETDVSFPNMLAGTQTFATPAFGEASYAETVDMSGTLRARFYALRNRRSVHAKTGTLNKVTALSGYVFGPEQETGVAFSILVSGSSAHSEIRQRMDALVLEISDTLWASRGSAALASR